MPLITRIRMLIDQHIVWLVFETKSIRIPINYFANYFEYKYRHAFTIYFFNITSRIEHIRINLVQFRRHMTLISDFKIVFYTQAIFYLSEKILWKELTWHMLLLGATCVICLGITCSWIGSEVFVRIEFLKFILVSNGMIY